MEINAYSERLKLNEEDFDGLDGECMATMFWTSCSERDFDNHGCSKIN